MIITIMIKMQAITTINILCLVVIFIRVGMSLIISMDSRDTIQRTSNVETVVRKVT